MPSDRRLVYWDADVFLSYIEGMADRLQVLEALLAESSDAKDPTEIVTSVLSMTEVAFDQAEKAGRALDPEIQRRIDQLWADTSAVKLAEYHELIALEARDLIRAAVVSGWSLKPADAVHLATAKRLGVAEFHTYDAKLDKYSALIGVPIGRPQTQKPRLL